MLDREMSVFQTSLVLLYCKDIETLNLSRFRHGGVNITGFQLINHSNSAVREFLRTWSVLEPAVWPGAGSDKVEVDAALSVDTLEAFRLALEAMVGRRHDVFHSTFRRGVVYNLNKTVGIPCSTRPVLPWMHGTEIYYSLKRVDFEGLTGRVSFDNRGYRNNYKLDIFTVSMDKGPSKTGEWHSEYGLERQQQFVAQPSANGTHAQRCRIVTSILTKPFLMMRQAPGSMGLPLTGNDKYEGYCKDLADELKERLLMEYILVPVKDGQFGTQLPNGSWTGIIGELRRGLADLAVAPLTITSDRERVVDFSKPFMNIAISIMIKRPEMQKPGVFAFMEPFSVPLWACIVLAYIAVSLTVFVVSKFSPFELRIRSYRYDRYIVYDFNICNSFWFSMSALMMQGSDHCPRSVAGRVIGGAWWFFVLIVITSYTANLAAFLTIERMLHPIESADDLAKQTDIAYGMLESGSTRTFFQTSEVPIYRKMWNYMSTASPSVMVKTVEEGVERVRNSKGKYAFLIESSMNNYYNNRKPCDTMRVGGDLNLEGFGIATPHGSELKNSAHTREHLP